MTLGSLFDGSGGFPLAGAMCGITPVWASEIEPFPVAVTRQRFPKMKQLGDITKIDGAKIEPVDIITFGSPCQGLSVAGLQKGLEDERSCLFLEATRIIKEMRAATNGKYPAYAIWENVPGAFSSNKGEDFRTVLEEFCKIKDINMSMPRPCKRKNAGLEWRNAGSIMGNGYSLAWRVLNAQFWGVPQRRKRIFLVADFTGERAGKILFERKGLSRHFTQSKNEGQGVTAIAENGIAGACGFSGNNSITAGGVSWLTECSPTLQVKKDPHVMVVENHPADSRVILSQDGAIQTLTSRMGTGGGNVPMVLQPAICIAGNTIDREPQNGGNGTGSQEDISYTLNTVDRHAVCFEQQAYDKYIETNISANLKATSGSYGGGSETLICEPKHKYIIRRLTPLECCRLQGFPDWWCSDIPHSDSAEYKMWGNGVALPCVLYVLEGIANELKECGTYEN